MFWIMYHNASSEALSREIHNDSPWCCLVCGQPVGRRFETSAGYFARLAAGIVDALPFQHRNTADAAPVLLVAEYLCLDQCVSPPPYFTLIGASSVQPQRFWTVTPIVAGRAAESYGVNFSSSPQSRSQSWFR